MSRVYRIVSPHFDDATLSCSLFIAANPGSLVTTVFAGGPPSVSPLTGWDKATRYFRDGDDVISERRREDERSTALLRAKSEHLSFLDEQYRCARYGYDGLEAAELLSAISEELARLASQRPVDAWLMPLGLGHDDHRLTAAACLEVADSHDVDCYVYEELPYYKEAVAEVTDQIRDLQRRGFRLVKDDSLRSSSDRSLKRAAVRCHRSQLRTLGRRVGRAVRGPERIWRLEPG
jgi:LmbE family N-acetylglucosaminyl deacetylase